MRVNKMVCCVNFNDSDHEYDHDLVNPKSFFPHSPELRGTTAIPIPSAIRGLAFGLPHHSCEAVITRTYIFIPHV